MIFFVLPYLYIGFHSFVCNFLILGVVLLL